MPKKKQTKRKPTIKQKAAFKKTMENNGNVSKAMREVGYSPNTAKNPQTLTNSLGWEELLEKYLPDAELGQVHSNLLKACNIDHRTFPPKMSNEGIKKVIESVGGCTLVRIAEGEQAKHAYFWIPDGPSRKSGLDMAYKLKDRYAAQKIKFADDNAASTDEELEAKRRRLEKEMGKRRQESNKSTTSKSA